MIEVAPDILPWVENIYHRLFEKLLPVKKNMTIEFYDAAIYGYYQAAASHDLVDRKLKCKGLPQDSYEWIWHNDIAARDSQTVDACCKRVVEVLSGWALNEAADYLNGYAYGIKCQLRETGWSMSATTQTLQIYKAMLNNQHQIKELIKTDTPAREIAEFISEKATLNDGAITHSQRFCKTEEGKSTYLKTFQKLCERIGLPLPPRGRPSTNRKIATAKN